MHLRARLVCSEIYISPLKNKVHELFLQENCRGKYKGNRKIEISVFKFERA